jgi:hypothetical protein
MKFTLKDLPKASLNKIYAGENWKVRARLKDNYIAIIKSQFKHVFPKDKQYKAKYTFYFKSRALDVSNCVYMLKMVEDIIFEDDSYKIVKELHIKSLKGDYDHLSIEVEEINE